MTMTILPTRNEAWGYFGTMQLAGADPMQSWNVASAMIETETEASAEAVRDFLDSRQGRHFADDVASERDYAARAGLSRGAIQKAKVAGRLVLHPDGSIDAEASDARRAAATDPSKQRPDPAPKLKPVPTAAVAAVGDTLREHGLPLPSGSGATFLQAKTANEVLKSQQRRLKLSRLKGRAHRTASAPRRWSSGSPARPATPG